tara:strand:- start:552 stop:884 length:333 start_codon:yes stop_codon:yes gene_type:complete
MKTKINEQIINDLYYMLLKKKNSSEEKSYTSFLLKNPDLLAKKIGEEASELIIDFIKRNKEGVIKESSDLLYHLLVIWIFVDVKPEEIWNELSSRKLMSGFQEKKKRSLK